MAKTPSLNIGLVFDDSLDRDDGVAQYVKTLGAWLSSRGCKVSYLVGQTDLKEWQGDKVYSLSKNQKVSFNGNRLSIPWPADSRQISQLVSRLELDVLHVMMPHSPFMAQLVINALNPKTALIGTFHIFPSGPLAKAGGRLLSLWYGAKLRRFDSIVSVSQPAQQYAKDTFGISSEIVPNPVDLSKYKQAKPPKQFNDIVFLGRLVKRKGSAELIRAFHQLQTLTNREVNLVIAGDGPQRSELERLAKRLGLAGEISFPGYISEADKPGLLASAKIACFPSLYGESFGIVLVEAMAAGAGVVLGGNNPGYISVLGEQSDLIIDPRNTNDFARRLACLLSDQSKITELHKWQLSAVEQYDISVVGKKLIDLYNEQIARRIKKSNNKS